MKKALIQDTLKEIKATFGRFVAIFAIVALGVGFLAGLNATPEDMKQTADDYFDAQNLMDLRLLSTMGFTQEDVDELRQQPGVRAVMPTYSTDALIEGKNGQQVAMLHGLPFGADEGGEDVMNRPVLIEGRLPQNSGECVIDEAAAGTLGKIGDTITLSADNTQDTQDLLARKEFTIVGIVQSPYYISIQRGSSTLGNGTISCFVYIPERDFQSDYYLELFVTLDGAEALLCYSGAYDALRDKKKEELESFADVREQARYDEVTAEPAKEIEDAQNEWNNAQAEYEDKKEETGRELADAQAKLDEGAAQIEEAKGEIAQKEQELEEGEAQLREAQASMDSRIMNGQAEIDAASQALAAKRQEYSDAQVRWEAGKAQLDIVRQQISNLEQAGMTDEAMQLKAQADVAEKDLATMQEELENAAVQITAAENEFANRQAEFDTQIAEGRAQIEEARRTLDEGWAALEEAKANLEQAQNELQEKQQEYEEAQEAADRELADAQAALDEKRAEIDNARKELAEVAPPEWYVLGRDTNPGYVGFGADADRVAAVSQVFPVFFFMVAALVCLTTMTRMVEEQRTQIGVLKALGYGKGAVVGKYLAYAAIASVAGSITGLLVGFRLFPASIWNAYTILYTLPPIESGFHVDYALVASGAAVASTLLATLAACYRELHEMPAELIRPKAPAPGKRVWLEKIPALWKRLNFTQKVSMRNVFRYKKRFFMTIAGIGGCTMLMLTGFGLRDSIADIVTHQFDSIHLYDVSVTLADPSDARAGSEINEGLPELVEESIYITRPSVTVEAGGGRMDAYLFVPEEAQKLNDFVAFQDRVTGEPVVFPQPGKVVVTEKMASKLGLAPGDELAIRKGDTTVVQATVGGITENYIYSYIYMTAEDYETLFGSAPEFKEILATVGAEGTAEEEAISTKLLEQDGVESVRFTSKTSSDFEDVMKSLDSVVWLLIGCANLLAFIVLYNLVNINITERIREIATIKVLGFYEREVSNYVFRENIVLTVIGTAIGLVGGIFLHQFVVQTAEVDIVMFERDILPFSYVLSAALTFAFAFAVNFIMRFRLRKIDMVESLKSTE